MKKDYKWFTIVACFGVFICILFLCFAIYFTPNFVANYLSPDGFLEQITIVKINLTRIWFGILGTVVLLIIVLYFIKGNSFFLLQNSKAPFIIELLLLADLTLALIYLYSYGFHLNSYDIHLMKFFDLGEEVSIPTWYSSIKLFCISVLSALFAYHKFNRLDIRSWILLLLPLLFLTLSMDESAAIHEWLGHETNFILFTIPRIKTLFKITGTWMVVIGVPFLIFFIALMCSIKKYFNKKNYLLILFGMVIFLAGALGVEIITNIVPKNLIFIEVFCEELLEMIGVTIVFWGFYNLTDVNLHYILTAGNERTLD